MPIDATRARTCSSTRPLRDDRRVQEHLPRQRSYLFDVPSDTVDVLSDLEVIRLLAVAKIRVKTTAGISSKAGQRAGASATRRWSRFAPRSPRISDSRDRSTRGQGATSRVPEVPRDQPENRPREHRRRRPGVQQPEVALRAHRWYEDCLGLRPWRVSGTTGLAANRAISRRRTHFNDSHLISLVGR